MTVNMEGLSTIKDRVYEAMKSGDWMTLEQVASKCGYSYPSTVASRLRDLGSLAGSTTAAPKPYTYEKRLIEGTKRTFEYRLFETPKPMMEQLSLLEAV